MRFAKLVRILVFTYAVDVLLFAMIIFGLVVGVNAEEAAFMPDQAYPDIKVVALTFDDGPNRDYTERLLDGLKERNVKASFFLLGKCIEGNEALIERMAKEGHLIGIHGMDHVDLTKTDLRSAVEQIQNTADRLHAITGSRAEYIRPPFGSWNQQLEEEVQKLQLITVFWDVDSLDWKRKDVGKIVKNVWKDVDNGDIILLHDEFSWSVEAAFRIIDKLRANGYTFVTVNELMVD